jgi:hypothetical protein
VVRQAERRFENAAAQVVARRFVTELLGGVWPDVDEVALLFSDHIS